MSSTLLHIPSLASVSRCLAAATTLFALTSCAIKDDIPYPIREAVIVAFEVEGQCDESDNGYVEANINKSTRTVEVNVSDTMNVAALTIKRFEVTNDATINPESGVCLYPDQFPRTSFWRTSGDTSSKVNFSSGSVTFTLTTYQDYIWTVNVHQVIIPEVQLDGQVGDAVIDATNHNIVVYVSADQNLSAIAVHKFRPAGQHCTVSPDPTATSTFDFSKTRSFTVTSGNGKNTATWQVFVYHTTAQQQTTASAFARSVSATISGQCTSGVAPTVVYRQQGETVWTTLTAEQIEVNGSRYSAELTGLTAGGSYEYQVSSGNNTTSPQTFTTAAPQQLENNSLDQWHVEGTGTKALYCPWAEGAKPYWDTGNHGATTVGASNSTYGTEAGRIYANLESKYIVVKFAAGNIFTGEYLETDGTNGVLNFGRPFSSFPTKLRFDYKYKTSTITRTGGDWKEAYGDYISRQLYEGLKGKPDSCSVYIALGDWEPVDYKGTQCRYLIRTRPSALHLMDLKDSHLIAFGQMTCGHDVNSWTTETIDIDYRVRDRKPTTIIVVASSSKYGDYFTGGEGSLLQIDNLELLY